MKNKIAELTISRAWVNINSRAAGETVIATVIVVIIPALLAHTPQNQFIVGPIVNAVLFWVALRIGLVNAIFIAVIPSLIALSRGLLPPQAAIMIPFIILGNCAMITTFWYFVRNKSHAGMLDIVISSIVKSLIIFLPVWLLLNLPPIVTFMMSWPQLVTAFVGGSIVVLVNNKIFSAK